MKTIKTILLIIMVVLLSTSTQAQLQLGVRAGVNLNSISHHGEGFESRFGDLSEFRAIQGSIGFHVGISAEVPIKNQWSIRTGLYYTRKGFDIDLESVLFNLTLDGYNSIVMDYLEIPLGITYCWKGLGLTTGPYVGIGIRGEHSWDYLMNARRTEKGSHELNPNYGKPSEDVRFRTGEEWNWLDWGWMIEFSYRLKRWQVSTTYDLGLANTTVKTESTTYVNKFNRNLMFSLTYFFISNNQDGN